MPIKKYIFITGGVVSSLGKGITAASLGFLLKARGIKVTIIKLDPYINVDAGTMNPFQHGEVFVTEDGAETDLDLGHYERFLEENLSQKHNLTTGKIYGEVITKERKGVYLGDTVQVIPHITDQIKKEIIDVVESSEKEVGIVEVGGTVGDIEGLPFLEAIRQFQRDLGSENVLYIHVTLLPYLKTIGELKTKPTQHSVKELRSLGITPNIILCRTQAPLTAGVRKKLSLFCGVNENEIIESRDCDFIYEVPLLMEKGGLGDLVVSKLKLPANAPDLSRLQELCKIFYSPKPVVNISLVGKYVELKDAYISLEAAILHGALANKLELKLNRIDAELLEKELPENLLSDADGILVPGGFGKRGQEGKILAVKFARDKGIPYLGICYGLQCAVIEIARNLAGLKDANSTEVDPNTPYPVIDLLPEQGGIDRLGGTMRVGAFSCKLVKSSLAYKTYGVENITERHRHRYEFNNNFRKKLEDVGVVFSGINIERNLVEILELPSHPWFLATQFHPEFKSHPLNPHPIFVAFLKAAYKYRESKLK